MTNDELLLAIFEVLNQQGYITLSQCLFLMDNDSQDDQDPEEWCEEAYYSQFLEQYVVIPFRNSVEEILNGVPTKNILIERSIEDQDQEDK